MTKNVASTLPPPLEKHGHSAPDHLNCNAPNFGQQDPQPSTSSALRKQLDEQKMQQQENHVGPFPDEYIPYEVDLSDGNDDGPTGPHMGNKKDSVTNKESDAVFPFCDAWDYQHGQKLTPRFYRHRKTPFQLSVLRAAFAQDPYINRPDAEKLARLTHLSPAQVQYWFALERRTTPDRAAGCENSRSSDTNLISLDSDSSS